MKTYIQHYQLQMYQELILRQPQTVLISSTKFMQMLNNKKTNIKQQESIGGNTLIEGMNGIKEN